MEIIEQSHEFLHFDNPLKLIEAAGRNCYKSEGKITDTSAGPFVKLLAKTKKHFSVLEHAWICFQVDDKLLRYIHSCPHARYLRTTKEHRCLVSGNFRAWVEFLEEERRIVERMDLEIWVNRDLQIISYHLFKNFPEVFTYFWAPIVGDAVVVTEESMIKEEKLVHATRSIRIITDRGNQQEMTRHRPWAYSIESTRYVDYLKNILFIKPAWFDSSTFIQRLLWKGITKFSELAYKGLRKVGWKPEQARSVLTLSLSGEIVMTAPLDEWKHMLEQRCGKAAHPQLRALMRPILAELKTDVPAIFNELTFD